MERGKKVEGHDGRFTQMKGLMHGKRVVPISLDLSIKNLLCTLPLLPLVLCPQSSKKRVQHCSIANKVCLVSPPPFSLLPRSLFFLSRSPNCFMGEGTRPSGPPVVIDVCATTHSVYEGRKGWYHWYVGRDQHFGIIHSVFKSSVRRP